MPVQPGNRGESRRLTDRGRPPLTCTAALQEAVCRNLPNWLSVTVIDHLFKYVRPAPHHFTCRPGWIRLPAPCEMHDRPTLLIKELEQHLVTRSAASYGLDSLPEHGVLVTATLVHQLAFQHPASPLIALEVVPGTRKIIGFAKHRAIMAGMAMGFVLQQRNTGQLASTSLQHLPRPDKEEVSTLIACQNRRGTAVTHGDSTSPDLYPRSPSSGQQDQ